MSPWLRFKLWRANRSERAPAIVCVECAGTGKDERIWQGIGATDLAGADFIDHSYRFSKCSVCKGAKILYEKEYLIEALKNDQHR